MNDIAFKTVYWTPVAVGRLEIKGVGWYQDLVFTSLRKTDLLCFHDFIAP